jgi:hypothetical protein
VAPVNSGMGGGIRAVSIAFNVVADAGLGAAQRLCPDDNRTRSQRFHTRAIGAADPGLFVVRGPRAGHPTQAIEHGPFS